VSVPMTIVSVNAIVMARTQAPIRACDDTAVPILMHQCTDRPAGPAEGGMRSCIRPGSGGYRFLIILVCLERRSK
jgi:hypothetical protein